MCHVTTGEFLGSLITQSLQLLDIENITHFRKQHQSIVRLSLIQHH